MKQFILILALLASSFDAIAADMTNDADNFYKSDKVTTLQVTFKNQYQMEVAAVFIFLKGWIQAPGIPRSSSGIPWAR